MSGQPQQKLTATLVPVSGIEDELVGEWDKLGQDLRASPFMRPEFLLVWQRWFGDGDLMAATARRGEDLVGLLPLVRQHGVLRYPANWHTPIAGVLASDAEASAALADAIGEAHARHVAIALLDGADVRLAEMAQRLRERRFRLAHRDLGRSPYRDLSGDWEQFEAAMNAKERRDLRRRRRRLEELGAVSVEHVTDAVRLDHHLDEAYSVEGSDWKDRRGSAIRANETTTGFYTEVAQWAAREGYLRLTFLRLDGEPLAVSLALWADGVHYGLKMGYNVAFAKYVPGLLLMHEIMHAAFVAGLRRVEMLGEDDPYKRIWCDRARERVGLQAFAPSLGGAVSWVALTQLRPLAVRLGARRVARLMKSEGPRL